MGIFSALYNAITGSQEYTVNPNFLAQNKPTTPKHTCAETFFASLEGCNQFEVVFTEQEEGRKVEPPYDWNKQQLTNLVNASLQSAQDALIEAGIYPTQEKVERLANMRMYSHPDLQPDPNSPEFK